ncbi:unnamed protein product [Miscanthus lutarioriparius]|uniref:Uncharacterized protein n=1 Tax=Miscanthus lutarioriparius TaxID=422564 RepID=A0A811R458_9POAL|nr:unnamed protein product [Miscanthus lutarioriparius]
MRLNKVEVNLIRLLEAAPRQQNQAKLVYVSSVPVQYVTTARELLEQLGAETTPEGISSISKAKLSEYSEKIEALASRLAASVPENEKQILKAEMKSLMKTQSQKVQYLYHQECEGDQLGSHHQEGKGDIGAPIKLDAEAQAHIEKHRKLQEDLTDEMVELAQQLKERSLMMNQSVQETEKILDSTERAVEQSLASTGHATSRAAEVYSLASKTTCFQWLLMFVMTCMFVMVVLLIRIT